MTQREKILAAAVGGLVIVVIAYFALTTINKSFAQLQSTIDDLDLQIGRKETNVALGNQARSKLTVYQRRSLPGDLGDARSQYQEWLLATTIEYFGQDKVSVKLKEGRRQDDTYVPVNFSIVAEGKLEQLTRFLYRFYEMDYLHRIDWLRVEPSANSRELKLNFNVEALTVYGAEAHKQLGEERGDRVRGSTEDDYLKVVLGRNLFGPPNNPPQLDSIRTPSVELGDTLSADITARDQDLFDAVTFRLEKSPPDMRLLSSRNPEPGQPATARLIWRPDSLGTYHVVVAAIDDGYPNKEDRLEFEVNVREKRVIPPPPPRDAPKGPPPFDHSRYTILTSVQQINGEGVVWFYTRTKNEKIVCREGEEVKVGPYTALVRHIDIDKLQVELEVEDEVLVLALGGNLRDARRKENVEVGSTGASGSVAPID